MTEIEAAKKLLERALKTGDQELIKIATDLLSKYDQEPTQEPKKRGRKKKVIEETTNYVSNVNNISSKAGAVKWTGNTWRDTGELGELGAEAKKTPKIIRTPRDREKFKKVSVTCTACNKTLEVSPAYVTSVDSFKCDRCLSRMVGR